MGNNKSQQLQTRVGRDIMLPSIKPYMYFMTLLILLISPGQGDDDELPNKRGDGNGAGADNDDDFDEKNAFAALMNQPIPVAESRFT